MEPRSTNIPKSFLAKRKGNVQTVKAADAMSGRVKLSGNRDQYDQTGKIFAVQGEYLVEAFTPHPIVDRAHSWGPFEDAARLAKSGITSEAKIAKKTKEFRRIERSVQYLGFTSQQLENLNLERESSAWADITNLRKILKKNIANVDFTKLPKYTESDRDMYKGFFAIAKEFLRKRVERLLEPTTPTWKDLSLKEQAQKGRIPYQ
jgi:hypothetical protein